jgi:hypothetical protein
MKKITTYIKDGGIILNLRDPLILTHESKLFVKTAASCILELQKRSHRLQRLHFRRWKESYDG